MLKADERRSEELFIVSAGVDMMEEESLEEIVQQAYKELETSRRRAQITLANARLEASEICQQARAEAARIVEQARVAAEVEAQSRRLEIEDEARRKGREEGLALAATESRGALATARQLKSSLENAYRHHVRESEREMLDTVLAIAERVVSLEQEEFREVLGTAIHHVLQEHSEAANVTLVLNPADYDAVIKYLIDNESTCDQIEGISATASVPAGTCKFRSALFNLDLSLARRFEQVREHLRQQWDLARSPERKD